MRRQQPCDDSHQPRGKTLPRQLHGFFDRVRLAIVQRRDTFGGRGRRHAGHAVIHRGPDAVQVGPGTLPVFRVVLLERRVAGRHHGSQRFGVLTQRQACGAEVEQHGGTLATQQNVCGFHVAVQKLLRVHTAQALQQRRQHREYLLLAQHTALAQTLRQRVAPFEVHHQVCGTVGLDEADHPHDARIAEFGQRARLVEEALQPVLVVLDVRFGLVGQPLAVRQPVSQTVRQVFLYRHRLVEHVVVGPVSNAEASDTEHVFNLVVLDAGPLRQGVVVDQIHTHTHGESTSIPSGRGTR